MPIRELRSIEGVSASSAAPICIIGGGVAGLLVARRLATKGQRVVVIESGYDRFDDEVHSLNEIDDPTQRFTRSLTGRFRGLGGSSTRWGGRMIPLHAHDTCERKYLDQPAWPFEMSSLNSYAQDIQDLFGVGPGSFETLPRGSKAAAKFPAEEDTLTPRWPKCPSFRRCNMATLLRTSLSRDPNLEIWLGATVSDFQVDAGNGRLRAVVAKNFIGKTLQVSATDFIFACGAIESTRLLLLLDRSANNRIFDGCDALGRYLQDHLEAEVASIDRHDATATNTLFAYRFINSTRRDLHLELASAAQERESVASAYFFVSMDLEDGPLADVKRIAQGWQRRELDRQALGRLTRQIDLLARASYWRLARKQLFLPASVPLNLVARIEQAPDCSNQISLSEQSDQFGLPKARVTWKPTEPDERCFRSAITNLVAYWARSGFDRLCPLLMKPFVLDPKALLTDHANDCAHPSGSTRMGTDPRMSVVRPDLRCHAIPNVAVASTSVFPTAGSANPTYTLMLLALWLADTFIVSS